MQYFPGWGTKLLPFTIVNCYKHELVLGLFNCNVIFIKHTDILNYSVVTCVLAIIRKWSEYETILVVRVKLAMAEFQGMGIK